LKANIEHTQDGGKQRTRLVLLILCAVGLFTTNFLRRSRSLDGEQKQSAPTADDTATGGSAAQSATDEPAVKAHGQWAAVAAQAAAPAPVTDK